MTAKRISGKMNANGGHNKRGLATHFQTAYQLSGHVFYAVLTAWLCY